MDLWAGGRSCAGQQGSETVSVPSQWSNLSDWQRMVARDLNRITQGFPFLHLDSDPTDVTEGFTYYNTVSNKVRTWDGSAWNNHW
jgi:hypothetical protein